MTTEIDYFGIKERIVAILKDDTTNLFSATPKDKTKFRKIEAGAPDANSVQEAGQLPRAWVTNDDIIDEITEAGSRVANSPKASKHTMRFLIIFAVHEKDGPKTSPCSH